jgi:hypothetical protein
VSRGELVANGGWARVFLLPGSARGGGGGERERERARRLRRARLSSKCSKSRLSTRLCVPTPGAGARRACAPRERATADGRDAPRACAENPTCAAQRGPTPKSEKSSPRGERDICICVVVCVSLWWCARGIPYYYSIPPPPCLPGVGVCARDQRAEWPRAHTPALLCFVCCGVSVVRRPRQLSDLHSSFIARTSAKRESERPPCGQELYKRDRDQRPERISVIRRLPSPCSARTHVCSCAPVLRLARVGLEVRGRRCAEFVRHLLNRALGDDALE